MIGPTPLASFIATHCLPGRLYCLAVSGWPRFFLSTWACFPASALPGLRSLWSTPRGDLSLHVPFACTTIMQQCEFSVALQFSRTGFLWNYSLSLGTHPPLSSRLFRRDWARNASEYLHRRACYINVLSWLLACLIDWLILKIALHCLTTNYVH